MAKLGIRAYYKLHPYKVMTGQNGMKYVDRHTVRTEHINLSLSNSKTGKVIAFNLPVEMSCDHKCECYSKRNCYACGGCYNFSLNQAMYAENLTFFLMHNSSDFVERITTAIKRHKSRKLFRWFTCGDILNKRFLACMIEIARQNPGIKFWTYTKKYEIVNRYIDEYGIDAMPGNLTIIFSHWRNDDGTYFPMNNKHNLPTSEFVPMGQEEMIERVTFVCPCSNPGIVEHCENCSHPCYDLKHGQSMALIEHSTQRTRERDNVIKALRGKMKDFDLIAFLKSFPMAA